MHQKFDFYFLFSAFGNADISRKHFSRTPCAALFTCEYTYNAEKKMSSKKLAYETTRCISGSKEDATAGDWQTRS